MEQKKIKGVKPQPIPLPHEDHEKKISEYHIPACHKQRHVYKERTEKKRLIFREYATITCNKPSCPIFKQCGFKYPHKITKPIQSQMTK